MLTFKCRARMTWRQDASTRWHTPDHHLPYLIDCAPLHVESFATLLPGPPFSTSPLPPHNKHCLHWGLEMGFETKVPQLPGSQHLNKPLSFTSAPSILSSIGFRGGRQLDLHSVTWPFILLEHLGFAKAHVGSTGLGPGSGLHQIVVGDIWGVLHPHSWGDAKSKSSVGISLSPLMASVWSFHMVVEGSQQETCQQKLPGLF